MARKTYVFQTNPDGTYKQPLEMVEKSERLYPYCGEGTNKYAHNILEDIEPYKSTIDGSVIGSRSKHRAHLREHGCVEIGTESFEKAQDHFKKPGYTGGADVLEQTKRAMEDYH